ncbi:hypothetical protein NMR74_003892 [Vibrio parahaemolyticus]|nr:hypothetical protein [Vibrio parahaemolyticus]
MYKCYDVNLSLSQDTIDAFKKWFFPADLMSNFEKSINLQNQKIEKALDEFYLSDGVLDAASLSQAWFPQIENNHIFLSHSHKDKDLAMFLAAILKETLDINVFIDSSVWGYADELLHKIDNTYAYNDLTESYSYEIRNRTTSNIYLILQSSLASMIDASECLMFLNTENTVTEFENKNNIEKRTSSPWIMSELQFSAMVERKLNHQTKTRPIELAINKSERKNFKISHKLPMDHLIELTTSQLLNWLFRTSKQNKKGYDALTQLYSAH